MQTVGSIVAAALVLALAVWRWYASGQHDREERDRARDDAIRRAAHSDDDSDISDILRP